MNLHRPLALITNGKAQRAWRIAKLQQNKKPGHGGTCLEEVRSFLSVGISGQTKNVFLGALRVSAVKLDKLASVSKTRGH
jgi:hypothetical protein